MEKKMGIWLDSNETLIATSENQKFQLTSVQASKNGHYFSWKHPLASVKKMFHITAPSKEDLNDSRAFDEYINQIVSHIDNPDCLFVFGDAKLEKSLYKHMETQVDNWPKEVEVYEVDCLSPALRLRQMKAFLN